MVCWVCLVVKNVCFKYFYVGENMQVFPLFGFCVVLFVLFVLFCVISLLLAFKCICMNCSKVSYFSQSYTLARENLTFHILRVYMS